MRKDLEIDRYTPEDLVKRTIFNKCELLDIDCEEVLSTINNYDAGFELFLNTALMNENESIVYIKGTDALNEYARKYKAQGFGDLGDNQGISTIFPTETGNYFVCLS